MKKKKFNATNDNIEWAKWTWNPVTGCRHGCKYCYAHDIDRRFNDGKFTPCFHADRLNAPEHSKIPVKRVDEPGIKNVFVCSMADLFGSWVDQEWIDKVFDVCSKQTHWTYLYLTKNPARYLELDFPDNCWVGASATCQKEFDNAIAVFSRIKTNCIKFLSCEPLNEKITVPVYP